MKTFQAERKGKSCVKPQDRELVFFENANVRKFNTAPKETEEEMKGQNL